MKVSYHILLSHGLAVRALRAASVKPIQVGITLNMTSVHPASETDEDIQAAHLFDGIHNRFFIDPLLLGRYPKDVIEKFSFLFPQIEKADFGTISTPIDFLGINYYSRTVIRHDPESIFLQMSEVHPEGNEYSQMWEIYPDGLYELLMRVWHDYAPPVILITENGCPVPDGLDFDGKIRDYRRIRYIRDHLAQLHKAIQQGAPIKGYYVWSLMDNFEWAHGYRMRFGITYVDFQTQKRTVKESGLWYSRVIQENGFDPTTKEPC